MAILRVIPPPDPSCPPAPSPAARACAAIVLYYGFSTLIQYDALDRALARFKTTRDANAVPGYRARVREFEEPMGYGNGPRRAE